MKRSIKTILNNFLVRFGRNFESVRNSRFFFYFFPGIFERNKQPVKSFFGYNETENLKRKSESEGERVREKKGI